MIIIDNIEQGSLEWFKLKAGKPSASSFDKIVTTKGEPSKSRKSYLYKLAGEKVTGFRSEGFQSDAMLHGIETEQEAVNMYELQTGVECEKVGVVYKDEERKFLCSPDRIVGDGILEVKCPQIATHVEYLLGNKLPTKYFQQVQGQLFITGAEWCDFMSYYQGLKPLIVRVTRDETFISALNSELNRFCFELDKIVEEIK